MLFRSTSTARTASVSLALGALLLGTSTASALAPSATAAPTVHVQADPARVVIDGGSVRVGGDRFVTLRGAALRTVPARTTFTTDDPVVVTVTRLVDLSRLRLRVGGIDLPLPAVSGAWEVSERHVVLGSGDLAQVTAAQTFRLPEIRVPVPAAVRVGEHATLRLIDGGVAEHCATCDQGVTTFDVDAAPAAANALGERRKLHENDYLLAQWRGVQVLPEGATAVRMVLVWQLRNDTRHLAVESYLSGSAAPIRETWTLGNGWQVADPHRAALMAADGGDGWTRDKAGWASFAVVRPGRATTATPLSVTSVLGGVADAALGGVADFHRVSPGDGAFLADAIPADVLEQLPAEAAALARTTREDAEQSIAWGQPIAINAAMTKDHECTYDPNRAGTGGWTGTAPDLLVDCYQHQGGYVGDGRDEYWAEEHTKPHTRGVVVGWTATSRCWIYSARTNAVSFTHYIDRCRFHNSEHGDESMSALRTTFSNCVPEWSSCFRESDRVPNDGWKTYDFITCCDLAIPPFGFDPAEYASVWWTSNRAHVTDGRGWNTYACTYVNIQPMRSSGEGGYCNYHDGISP